MRRHLKIASILIILLTISLLIAFNLFYSRSSLALQKPTEKYNIHIIMKSYQGEPDFWRIVEQGVLVAEQEFQVNCFLFGPPSESDIDAQIQLVYNSIKEKPNAIILAATDYDRLVPACQEVRNAGIELILLDSDVNLADKLTLVSTDNYEIGRKLANLADNLTPPNGQIGMIGHVENTTTAKQRFDGFLSNLPRLETRFTEIKYCDGSFEVAKRQAIEMIKANPNLKCLVGLNETSALGISYALIETEKTGEIIQVACDSSERQIQFMEDGVVEVFVVQNPFNMGYLSVEAAVQALEGKKVDPLINIDSVIITKEDMYKTENQKLLFPFNESKPELMDK